MSEQPQTSEDDKPRRRWLAPTITGVLSLVVGVAIGSAASGDGTEPTAEDAPQPQPTVTETVTVGPTEDEQAALDARAEELDAQAAELEERAAALDEREAAIIETEEQVAANTVGDGVWVVGVDIEPGTYRAVDVSPDCYWGIYTSGTNQDDIINNGIPGGGNPQVTLSEGQDFESQRCGEWTKQ